MSENISQQNQTAPAAPPAPEPVKAPEAPKAPAAPAAPKAPAAPAAPKAPATPAPAAQKLIVSSSPHYHTKATVSSIMLWVIISLLPACAAGIWFFGWDALRVLVITTLAAFAFEWLSSKAMKRDIQVKDLSAVVTGVLLAMNLPSSTPSWICVIGAFVAVVIGKMIYGGIGCNPFNPALVGRVALLLAFPAVMTTWPSARTCFNGDAPEKAIVQKAETGATPAVTGATPLKFSKEARAKGNAKDLMESIAPKTGCSTSYWKLALGCGKSGSLGETCSIALLLGGILLICLNIIRWHVPVCYLGTVALITGIAWLVKPEAYADPLFHFLTGGLMLGAFFMATDMVTTPLSRTGAVIFAVGCGIITAAIRLWGNYPEGVSFSILIMNAFTPLIDRYTAGKPFGMPRTKGVKLS